MISSEARHTEIHLRLLIVRNAKEDFREIFSRATPAFPVSFGAPTHVNHRSGIAGSPGYGVPIAAK
jgi:hypothetical protein